jgi:hypothetical protein
MGLGRHSAAHGGFCLSSSRSVLTFHGTRRSDAGLCVLAAENSVMRCLVAKLAEVRRHVALQIAAIAIATFVAWSELSRPGSVS